MLWLPDTLNREGRETGTRIEVQKDGIMLLAWDG